MNEESSFINKLLLPISNLHVCLYSGRFTLIIAPLILAQNCSSYKQLEQVKPQRTLSI